MIHKHGQNILISEKIEYQNKLTVGHCSIVGWNNGVEGPIVFGKNCTIGNFCTISTDISAGDNLSVDNLCEIHPNATIGNNVKLLYGKSIYSNAIIGDNCIIGGDIPERCILMDRVTFMGEVAHSHHDGSRDWDTTDEPSPTIGNGSIIGVNSLIIGGITIGDNCYVSAGEILRHDLPDNTVYIKGQLVEINKFKGLIVSRY